MPCDGSYMNPTAGEKEAATRLDQRISRFADHLVSTLDTIREHILANPDEPAAGMPPAFLRALFDVDPIKGVEDLEKANTGLYHMVQLSPTRFPPVRALAEELKEYQDIITKNTRPPAVTLRRIERRQARHRGHDVDRLLVTFAQKRARANGQAKTRLDETITTLLNVDVTKPLRPQLGYDPDEY